MADSVHGSSGEVTGSKRTVSAIASLALGIMVVAAVGFTLHSASKSPQKKLYATVNGTQDVAGYGTLKHAFINESVWPDDETAIAHGAKADRKHPWPFYGPASHLVIPAHSLVTMTLKVYDGGEKLNHNYFAKVIGTVGNSMMVDRKSVSQLAPDGVQHTFTLHSLPTSTQDPLFVNVPLPVADPDNHPGSFHTVTFSFVTGGAGEYVWNCEYPCGDGTYAKFGAVMGAQGYMSGKVSVVNV
jgi:hypothetical protein